MPATELTSVESRVLDAIDEEALIDNLVDLIRVPSTTGTDAESDLQNSQARVLDELGLEVDSWKFDLDELRAHPLYPGEETDRLEGYGVVGVTPGGGHPALVLQGHVDVVPEGEIEKWDGRDPFAGDIVGRVLHGRGACDMKAGVAANLAVVRALRHAGVTLERPLAVHSVMSEEDGGLGAFATMLRGHRGEAAVLTEPTTGRIVTACAGALTFRIEVAGKAAHGSTRLSGVSAFDVFLGIDAAIKQFEAERNANPDPLFRNYVMPFGISIGKLQAGNWSSSVPESLVAEGRMGVILGEDPAEARAAFEERVAAASTRDPWLTDHPAIVTWPGGQFASGSIDAQHEFIDEVSASISDLTGTAPERAAAPYGSDLRLYAGIGGIPTLHFGPGDVRFAHAVREQMNLDELISVTRSLALLAARRCGAHL
ncbi:acetylornithine deacetylase [Cryobacterium mesophilum]|uniref:ArgE/DapE family deacylase n=1 Tax=Terrimesophilobacter mesophilus TaxID=433647 RepID=A0A4R8VDY7_9MICO|nr:ArgE/DapE family deacylase [Terrimesophilobacter mesophilus]MBB5633672.1 acetylornithine deacetylase [Terrimesophilobacter mesophilus]TFB80362.1 ArgE/DapE family deacylase [Terrimesophilobacter mesophilus]